MDLCPDKNILKRFQRGETFGSEQLCAIAEHLSDCEPCSAAFDQIVNEEMAEFSRAPQPATKVDHQRDGTERDVGSQELEYWPPPTFLDSHPKWKILELLGSGGMGAVYLAQQRTAPECVVAIKILCGVHASKPELLRRFHREIEIMRTLGDHQNLVRVIDAEEVDGQVLLIVEYIEGRSFSELLKNAPGGRLDWQKATDLILQVLLGLEYAWGQHRLVHRDIKPGNLMLTTTGTVKILDFGLAKIQAPSQRQSLTMTSISAGTPAYCAPEQDQDFKQAAFHADLYSVGCTLFELIAGSKVFGTETGHLGTVAVRIAHHKESPRRLRKMVSDLPRPLESTIRRLLAKQPSKRFPSYQAAIEDLMACASESAVKQIERVKPEYRSTPKTLCCWPLLTYWRKAFRSNRGRRTSWLLGSIFAAVLLSALAIQMFHDPAEGVLKILVDAPDAIVVVNGSSVTPDELQIKPREGKFEITLRLPAGWSEIDIRKVGGSKHEHRRVDVSSNGVVEISVSLFAEPDRPKPETQLLPETGVVEDRTARLLMHSGQWQILDDKLCHFNGKGEQWLVFGDAAWTDYDFSFEAQHLGFPAGFTALFRSPVDEQVTLFSFGWLNFHTALMERRDGDVLFKPIFAPEGPYRKQLSWALQADRWYQVMVRVRGETAKCYVNGEQIFEVSQLPYRNGRVGVRLWRTWKGRSEFKNFKVVAPGGDVLWSGLPALPDQ